MAEGRGRMQAGAGRSQAEPGGAPPGERLKFLSLVDIFGSLSEGELGRLDRRLSHLVLGAGEILFGPEDPCRGLFLLRRGRVRQYRCTGSKEFTLSLSGPGEVFGLAAFSPQGLQEMYAQAVVPSRVSVLRRADMERLILERPEVGLRLVEALSEHLRRDAARIEDIAVKGAIARLAGLLLLLLESEGVVTGRDRARIPTHYTHRNLGDMIGVGREAVTRAFARLQDEGIVELKRRLIHVVDTGALRDVAGCRRA